MTLIPGSPSFFILKNPPNEAIINIITCDVGGFSGGISFFDDIYTTRHLKSVKTTLQGQSGHPLPSIIMYIIRQAPIK